MSLKAQQLSQRNFYLRPKHSCGESIEMLMSDIKEFIITNDCNSLILDLSGYNLIYASQLGILAATHHFINYINGEVTIIVDNDQTKEAINILNLANAKIVLTQNAYIKGKIA